MPMLMRRPRNARRREPTIALINIVFLMLIFFMLAGTLTRPLAEGLDLVETAQLTGSPPQDALILHADGRLEFQGEPLDVAAFLALKGAPPEEVRIIPDRSAAAADLVQLGAALKAAGAKSVMIVTEKALR